MAEKRVAAEPPAGSVEFATQKLRSYRGENRYACAFGLAQAYTMIDVPAETALEYIRNVVTAVDSIHDERLDPSGLAYSRPAEDVKPTADRRVPSHFQHSRDDGVDELPAPCFVPNGFQAPEVVVGLRAECQARHPDRDCVIPGAAVVHLSSEGDTACEKDVADLPDGHSHDTDHEKVNCPECLLAVPF